jgi:hypothetical protein
VTTSDFQKQRQAVGKRNAKLVPTKMDVVHSGSEGSSQPSSAARRPMLPYNPSLHDGLLTWDLKRAAETIANELWSKKDRKQTRIAFEKYVTHCITQRLLHEQARPVTDTANVAKEEQSEHPFVDDQGAEMSVTSAASGPCDSTGADTLAESGFCAAASSASASGESVASAASLASSSAATEERELRSRFAGVLSEVKSEHGADASLDDVMDSLCTHDDPRFDSIVNTVRHLNELVAKTTEVVWSRWERGTWACACDGVLGGPFSSTASLEEHMNRAQLWQGSLKWQIAIRHAPLLIDAVMIGNPMGAFPELPHVPGSDTRPGAYVSVLRNGVGSSQRLPVLVDTGSQIGLFLLDSFNKAAVKNSVVRNVSYSGVGEDAKKTSLAQVFVRPLHDGADVLAGVELTALLSPAGGRAYHIMGAPALAHTKMTLVDGSTPTFEAMP